MAVAFRRHTLLPLDDCLYALQPTIPHLTRSSLHRCLQRHGISRLPDVEGDKPAKKKFKRYPIGYFHIDIVNRLGMGTLDRRPNGTPLWSATVSARLGGAGQGCAARSGASERLSGSSFECGS